MTWHEHTSAVSSKNARRVWKVGRPAKEDRSHIALSYLATFETGAGGCRCPRWGRFQKVSYWRETRKSCPARIGIAGRPGSWQVLGGFANGGFAAAMNRSGALDRPSAGQFEEVVSSVPSGRHPLTFPVQKPSPAAARSDISK